jgi:hypothetical protein
MLEKSRWCTKRLTGLCVQQFCRKYEHIFSLQHISWKLWKFRLFLNISNLILQYLNPSSIQLMKLVWIVCDSFSDIYYTPFFMPKQLSWNGDCQSCLGKNWELFENNPMFWGFVFCEEVFCFSTTVVASKCIFELGSNSPSLFLSPW